jgi:hypothetical protein
MPSQPVIVNGSKTSLCILLDNLIKNFENWETNSKNQNFRKVISRKVLKSYLKIKCCLKTIWKLQNEIFIKSQMVKLKAMLVIHSFLRYYPPRERELVMDSRFQVNATAINPKMLLLTLLYCNLGAWVSISFSI